VAYLVAGVAGLPARTIGFASVVATQLAQTLDMGWAGGRFSKPIVGAVVASSGLLIGALTIAPMRNLLTLSPLSPAAWGLIAAASIAAVVISRSLSFLHRTGSSRPVPAPAAS